MITIYFDKQLFSHLFKSQEEKYLVLREKILSHRDEFIWGSLKLPWNPSPSQR